MNKLASIFVFSVFLAVSPAVAAGAQDKWIVMQLSGDARVIHPGLQPASLKVNAQVVSGDILVTGVTGRATLVRGADYIIIAPRSELRLPTTPEATGFTRVVERIGTMLFKIQHTGIPHFAVDTPMLAAVVKGTTFSITVDQNRSAVQVIQGAVQVTATEGGMSRIVEGGRTVFVNHADPKTLLDADKPVPPTTEPSSNSVKVSAAEDNSLASVSQLTAGLVRIEADFIRTARALGRFDLGACERRNRDVHYQSCGDGGSDDACCDHSKRDHSERVRSWGCNPLCIARYRGVGGDADFDSPQRQYTSRDGAEPDHADGHGAVGDRRIAVDPHCDRPEHQHAYGYRALCDRRIGLDPVSTPTVTVPSVSLPTLTVPAVSTPTLSTPTVTVPSVTVPSVSTPILTIPAVSTPAVTIPSVTVPCLFRC